MDVTGVVAAGGASTRFGSDKALHLVDGTPMAAHVVDALAAVCGEVLVATAPGRVEPYRRLASQPRRVPVRIVADRHPGRGPLAALESGLLEARCEWVLLAACDAPRLSVPLLRALTVAAPGHLGVLCQANGRPQPMPGLYHRSLLPSVEELLARGDAGPVDLRREARFRLLEEDEARPFDPGLASFEGLDVRPGGAGPPTRSPAPRT